MKENCEHYESCRLPVQQCNGKCKKYELAEWAKPKPKKKAA